MIRLANLSVAALLLAGCADRPIVFGEGGTDGGNGQSGDPCQTDHDCASEAVCFEGTCVQEGVVRVSLSWNVLTDYDLHVETPGGQHLFFKNTVGGGGKLDVDDCVHGECRDNARTHVENIYFNETAASGHYSVWVVNFDGRDTGEFGIEVAGAVEKQWAGELPAQQAISSEIYSFNW